MNLTDRSCVVLSGGAFQVSGAPSGKLVLILTRKDFFPERVVHHQRSDKILLSLCWCRNSRSEWKAYRENNTATVTVSDLDASAVMVDDEITGYEVNGEFMWIIHARRKRIKH